MSKSAALPEAYVSASRLMELFSVSRETIRTWVREGKLPPPIKVSNRPYWHPAEIEEFAARVRSRA